MIRMLRKKIHKQIQNIHSKSVRLENILARKYSVLVSRSWQKKGGKIYRCKKRKNLLKL